MCVQRSRCRSVCVKCSCVEGKRLCVCESVCEQKGLGSKVPVGKKHVQKPLSAKASACKRDCDCGRNCA